MPRATPRIQNANVLYHVMNRGNEKQTLFLEDTDYEYFLSLLFSFKNKYQVLLFHFVIMPNHFHLLLEPTSDQTIAPFIKMVTQCYALYFRKKYGGIGHVWQNRYKNIPIESEQYYLRCSRYIELNPARANIVQHPKDYKWSSYAILASNKLKYQLDTHPIFAAFNGNDPDKNTYKNFIALGIDEIAQGKRESFSKYKAYGSSAEFMRLLK